MKTERFHSTAMLAEIAWGELADQSDAHIVRNERLERRARWARRKSFKVAK